MKSKKVEHTPGPWKLEAGRSIVTDGGRFNLAYSTDKKTGAASFPNFVELDANAALIAAAPDLLKSLEAVTGMYEAALGGKYDDPDEAEIIDKARAAIAKARGE
jgi:hypothetical protein